MQNKKLFIFYIFLFFTLFSYAQENIPSIKYDAFSSDAILSFADYLYEENFFSEASAEYERYLFIKKFQSIDENSPEEKIIFKLSTIYDSEKNFNKIISLEKSFSAISALNLRSRLFALESKYYFLNPQLSFDYKDYVNQIKNKSLTDNLNCLLDLSALIYAKDFLSAKDFSKALANSNDFFTPVNLMLEKYKSKKAGLALFLSLLCPGLGKVYNGAYSQGFSAFISVASLASACGYFAWKNGIKDWKTWTFGAMGAGLWVVDVYGAFSGSKRVNKANYKHLQEAVSGLFDEI